MLLRKALTFKTVGSRFADSDDDEYGSPFGGSREQDDYY